MRVKTRRRQSAPARRLVRCFAWPKHASAGTRSWRATSARSWLIALRPATFARISSYFRRNPRVQRPKNARKRARRKEIARERGVPPYVVFSDATLLEMASARPKTQAQMLGISGVGPTKLEHYGERFLKALAE